jgi:hypothetical protein
VGINISFPTGPVMATSSAGFKSPEINQPANKKVWFEKISNSELQWESFLRTEYRHTVSKRKRALQKVCLHPRRLKANTELIPTWAQALCTGATISSLTDTFRQNPQPRDQGTPTPLPCVSGNNGWKQALTSKTELRMSTDSQLRSSGVWSCITEEVGANTLDHLTLVVGVDKSLHTQGHLPTNISSHISKHNMCSKIHRMKRTPQQTHM